MKETKSKPHLNIGTYQGLGRYFRAGVQRLVIHAPPIEAEIAARLKQKLLIMDESVLLKNGQTILFPQTESTGLSLHPFQKRALKRILRDIKKVATEPSH